MIKGSKHTKEAKEKIGLNGFHFGMLGKRHSEETREKMRASSKRTHLGTTLTVEHKLKLSKARKRFYANGGVHPRGMLGKHCSEETKKAMSEAHSGKKNYRWKGGYKNKLFHARQRHVMKKAIGGKHTLAEWDVLKKLYNFMCLCCKQQEPLIKLTEDHIVPLSKGGINDISNIQPLCQSCNSLKWTKVIDYRSSFLKLNK